jgi:hypothetical protein
MSCISRTPGRAPTPSQRDHLVMLLEAAAISRETAKGPYAPGMERANPNVIGALRDRGEALSRMVRNGRGSQFTAYWLTPLGIETAQSLRADASGER